MERAPGSSPAFQGLKQGQSRTGPYVGVRSSSVATHPSLPNLNTYLKTLHTLFKEQMALRQQSVLVTHYSESQQQNIRQLSDPREQTTVKNVL